MLLAEHDRDAVAELDELRLGERGMESSPERVVGPVGVPGDRIGPRERRALAIGEAFGVGGMGDDLLVLSQTAGAQLFQLALDDARLERRRIEQAVEPLGLRPRELHALQHLRERGPRHSRRSSSYSASTQPI